MRFTAPSVRARLTLWHAGVLVLVICLFSVGIFLFVRARLYRALDQQIGHDLATIEQVYREETGDLGELAHRMGITLFQVVEGDAVLFMARREQLMALERRYRIPVIGWFREFAVAGGLISYGPDLIDGNRQLGVYAAKILGGARPADLPVQQPTKFQLVINLETAKALGLTVPQVLLAQADEVID